MKGKLVKITVLFFIVMILFTILSRVTYNMSMATVETTQPARETMGPVIETKAIVDLYFNPNVAKYGLVNWKAFDAIKAEGYRHAKDVLAKLTEKELQKFK